MAEYAAEYHGIMHTAYRMQRMPHLCRLRAHPFARTVGMDRQAAGRPEHADYGLQDMAIDPVDV